jgi:formylglycine-generating enzyme required for sulfatase activity
MVKAGPVCIDKFEASVWSKPNGGTRYGASSDNYPCADNGQNCKGRIFARSVAGVKPSRFITWFQAQQALANSGKRLPTNAEWQMAVAGTPDPGPDNGTTNCNTTNQGSGQDPTNTGSRSACVSARGVHDMVGNLLEWVADWVPFSSACPGWGSFSNDTMCLSGASTGVQAPGVLLRGGNFEFGSSAGPFAIEVGGPALSSNNVIGFRGAR